MQSRLDQPAGTPNAIRVTVASLDEFNTLLQQGLDFYGATYFPTEPLKKDMLKGSKERKSQTDDLGQRFGSVQFNFRSFASL